MFKTDLMNILEKAMDGSSLKNTVVSNNIANVNTPGFKKSAVSFQKSLEKSLEKSQESALRPKQTKLQHLAKTRLDDPDLVQVYQVKDTTMRTDGNNVDIDMELATLAQNNLYFNSLAQFLSYQLSLLRYSISEGSK